ncbi:hypothetical protein [Helcococcus ovis]|nr:hypothetical protein [Helcococcus ovis]WNZ01428.1 hypothetical protein EQF90_000860 [Helcococcus ovis]
MASKKALVMFLVISIEIAPSKERIEKRLGQNFWGKLKNGTSEMKKIRYAGART